MTVDTIASQPVERPLGHYRVLEMPGVAPLMAGKTFADLGADVIKVEPPGGDPARRLPPLLEREGFDPVSLIWTALDIGKRHLTADLTTDEGVAAVRALAVEADVLIEAFEPGEMERLGLSRAELRKANPRLVITWLSAFGQDGPYAGWKGSDLVHFAMSGYLHMTGPTDGPPIKPSMPLQTYYHAAMHSVVGTLLALRQRESSELGTDVDQASRDIGTWMLTHTYQYWDMEQRNLRRLGASRDMGAFRRLRMIYPCKDGHLVWMASTGHIGGGSLKALVEWMHSEGLAPEWLREIDWIAFDYVTQGPEMIERLEVVFDAFFATKTKAEMLDWSLAHRLMMAPLQDLEDVINDPQLEARGSWRSYSIPGVEQPVRIPGSPARLSGAMWEPRVGTKDDAANAGWLPRTDRGALTLALSRGERGLVGEAAPREGGKSTGGALTLALSPEGARAQVVEAPHSGSSDPSPLETEAERALAAIFDAEESGLLERLDQDTRQPLPAIEPASTPRRTKKLPLEGIRIVDFSTTLAGPMASRHLADFGAEVIRVESSAHPDTLRVGTPYKDNIAGVNRSGYFGAYNAGKKSLALNMTKPESREIVRRLIKQADVVLEAYVPGVMDRWALGWKDLQALNPRLIMASHCLQGQWGPRASHRGYGQIAAAMTGWYDLTGLPGQDAVGPYSAYTDFVCWTFLATSILVALEVREQTGLGQHIDHAHVDTSIHFLAPLLLDLQINGHLAKRRGNWEDFASPSNAYQCAGDDRWLAVTVSTEEEWRKFCEVLGHPEVASDPRFTTLADRKANELALDELIGTWTRDVNDIEVATKLQAAGIAAGYVERASDLFADPQLAHRKLFRRLQHSELGDHAVITSSFRIAGLEPGPFSAAPLLGEHSFEVCSEILGMSAEEIAEYAALGVFE